MNPAENGFGLLKGLEIAPAIATIKRINTSVAARSRLT